MTTTRRRSIVAKPSFQIKLTIIFMLMVTIVANLVGGLCFFFLSSNEARSMLGRLASSPDYPDGIPVLEMAQLFIPKILIAEVISLVIVFMLCIWVTHTIAGPLYRMERVAGEIGEGDLSMFTRLRPKDELKELADAFNIMTRGLARRIYALRDSVAVLEAGGSVKDAVAKMRDTLDGFRLPERDVLNLPAPGDDDDDTDALDEDEGEDAADDPARTGAPEGHSPQSPQPPPVPASKPASDLDPAHTPVHDHSHGHDHAHGNAQPPVPHSHHHHPHVPHHSGKHNKKKRH
jgi:HAMP domain-containing protein